MKIRRVLGIASAALIIDQSSKFYVVHYLNLKEKMSIDVIDPILNFKMAWNRGINFGLFDSGGDASRMILVVISFAISAALLWWIRTCDNVVRESCVGLIVGGALGNAIDRIIFGAVLDFLNMSCCGINNPFSFNLADVTIFVGAFALILWDKNDDKVS